MKLNLKVYDSSVKHIKNEKKNDLKEIDSCLTVLKEEEFAFQVMLDTESTYFCQLSKINDISYRGLINKIRLEIEVDKVLENSFNMSFLGYVKGDDGKLIGDVIELKKGLLVENTAQIIWIDGKIPADYSKNNLSITVKAYYTRDYEMEVLLADSKVELQIINYKMPSPKEGDFFLDLWQHPSNWARAYDVSYFSEEHFIILDHYLEELSSIGQKVIDLIVTDYSWAGQQCYKNEENHANLFEVNMVKVIKDQDATIKCDFTTIDRYISLCMKYGIDTEINLFGLIGNWDAYAFGNPIEGHKDALRIQYYDEKARCFNYIKTKEELTAYLSLLFEHLVNEGLWDKTMIICDEPNAVDVFTECAMFLQSAVADHKIKLKCALHHQKFFDENGKDIKSLSLNTCEMIHNIDKTDALKLQIKEKGGVLTWYSCCFPEQLNIFLSSPLIECRLTGWFTFYFKMQGFLRWAFGVWPGNVFEDARYKQEKWPAGDMFLVYPGQNLKPQRSVRYNNFKYGIQDFNILKKIEATCSETELMGYLEELLGRKDKMAFVAERSVEMNYSLNYLEYMNLRNELVKKYLLRGEN